MNQQPNQDPHGLQIRDNHGSMHAFVHIADKNFWMSIEPASYIGSIPFSRKFEEFMNKLIENFPIDNPSASTMRRMERDRKNILKKLLKVQSDVNGEFVTLSVFIQMTKAIGPFREVDTGVDSRRTCVFLQQLRYISRNSKEGRGPTGQLSWFAGHMTSTEAEDKLMAVGNPPGTFLIRFSAGLSDEGAYALSVIARDGNMQHFNILGNPSEAANSHPYHCQLKLLHHENEELNNQEGSYGDIVVFRYSITTI